VKNQQLNRNRHPDELDAGSLSLISPVAVSQIPGGFAGAISFFSGNIQHDVPLNRSKEDFSSQGLKAKQSSGIISNRVLDFLVKGNISYILIRRLRSPITMH